MRSTNAAVVELRASLVAARSDPDLLRSVVHEPEVIEVRRVGRVDRTAAKTSQPTKQPCTDKAEQRPVPPTTRSWKAPPTAVPAAEP